MEESSINGELREVALSPASLIFHEPGTNCCIIGIMGSKTKFDVAAVKEGFNQTFLKHPRFSSKLVTDGGKKSWIQTQGNVEEIVIVPDIDIEPKDASQYVDDYITNLTTIPMDLSKPLWEFHILNLKTPDAEAVGIFRIHHSIGDGMSLTSFLLAVCRKSSDPEALPTVPMQKQKQRDMNARRGSRGSTVVFWLFMAIWSMLRIMFNTVVDVTYGLATIAFLKDTNTPLKGYPGIEHNPKRIVHRAVSLDDIKLVKNAMGMTINDVIMGVTQAGLKRYLDRKYDEVDGGKRAKHSSNDQLLRNIRLRATIMVNVRPTLGLQDMNDMMKKKSKAKWGNQIGFMTIPFPIVSHNDPLDYLRAAKAIGDRKKLSLEAICAYAINKYVQKLFGLKISAALVYRLLVNTTMTFSNLVGPTEEISFFGHPLSFLAASVYGIPQGLTFHFQSYMNKMNIIVAADPNLIPDPYLLCNDLQESLKSFKDAVTSQLLAMDAA